MNPLHESYKHTILRFNTSAIEQVTAIVELGSFDYTSDNFEALKNILQEGAYRRLSELSPSESVLADNISLIRFEDQRRRLFYALIQEFLAFKKDPLLLGLYPAVNK